MCLLYIGSEWGDDIPPYNDPVILDHRIILFQDQI